MSGYEALKDEAEQAIASATDLQSLDAVRIQFLGKTGKISEVMKGLGKLSPEERKEVGQALNQIKQHVSSLIDGTKERFEEAALNAKLEREKIDMTLPVREQAQGHVHPISKVIDDITRIFGEMGFTVATGPEIEDDFHNFTALNIPESHPARQMHDTFYLGENNEYVLRTHTSSVQIRTMEAGEPPFRIIAPGRTYRSDSDITHTPMFHQVEGLLVDKDINMGHLKGCLVQFLEAFFEVSDIPVRFRPSFFPFTEPSAELDIGCSRKGGTLTIGAGDDWLEVLGCGMVHPNVLKASGVNPDEYQGFAFGMGIERLAMLKYGIPDLRTFFDSDIRWLQHYGFRLFER